MEEYCHQEKGHGRHTTWLTKVYDATQSVKTKEWKNLLRYIHVHREIRKKEKGVQKTTIQDAYFIADLSLSAQVFHTGIREHWGIENKLHWVKDVVHGEDDNRLCKLNAPVNFSVFSTMSLNIHRKNGAVSITENQILFRANVKELFVLLRT